MHWSKPSPVSTSSSTQQPGVAAHRGRLHMVYQDRSTSYLMHGILIGGEWSVTKLGVQSYGAVALADYQDALMCVYRDKNGHLDSMIWDDHTASWGASQSTGFSSGSGAALLAHAGQLFIAFAQNSDDDKYVLYATWNGAKWGTANKINSTTKPVTNHAPALAVYDGRLHVLFTAGTAIQHYLHAGPYATNQPFLPLAALPVTLSGCYGLAAVTYNGLLDVIYADTSSLHGLAWNGGTWSALPVPTIPSPKAAAAAVVSEGALALFAPCESGTTYEMLQAAALGGGRRPLGATPLWTCGGAAWVQTGVAPTMFLGNAPYTIEAWVRLDDVSGTQYVASSFVSDTHAGQAGVVALAIKDGALALWRDQHWIDAPEARVAAGDWHHVAAVYDGGAVCLYLDGALVQGEASYLPDVQPAPRPLLLGAAVDAAGAPVGVLVGALRQVAIWSVPRSALQILQDMYARIAPQIGFVASVDFAGAQPADTSMRGVSLTTSGTPQFYAETRALTLTGAGGLDCSFTGEEQPGTLSFAPSAPRSVTAWVYPTVLPGGAPSYIVWRSGQYALGFSTSGWCASAGGGATVSSTQHLVKNGWTHVCMTYDGAVTTLYAEGLPVATTSGPPPSTAGLEPDTTTIGCQPLLEGGVRGGMVGSIAGVTVWGRCLTPEEVQVLVSESPLGAEALAANYDFCAGALDDATLQNPTPIARGAGGQIGLVREQIQAQECAGIDAIDTSVSIPYFPFADDALLDTRAMTGAQEKWLLELIVIIVLGFLGILGVSPGSQVTTKFARYLQSSLPKIQKALGKVFKPGGKYAAWGKDIAEVLLALATGAPGVGVDTVIGLMVSVIYDVLKAFYEEGLLRGMVEVVAENLSWWSLACLVASLGSMFVPAGAARILVQFGILAAQVIRHAINYPKGARIEAPPPPAEKPRREAPRAPVPALAVALFQAR